VLLLAWTGTCAAYPVASISEIKARTARPVRIMSDTHLFIQSQDIQTNVGDRQLMQIKPATERAVI